MLGSGCIQNESVENNLRLNARVPDKWQDLGVQRRQPLPTCLKAAPVCQLRQSF